ncbi:MULTISPECIES: arsenate reductase ArsC [unclassified Aeromicrobium]|uniref:arsenate reductase ArsC n=1 Tax=unclassified Aeromicrobium TaxID=2633570 RepID=UPI0028891327|nr:MULTISPECIES: arsenate reductase ArsC [unclassified Aeromicrobium]
MNETTPAAIADDLAYAFDGTFTPDVVTAAVAQAREALEPHATVQTYLPILVRRYATELLAAKAQADGVSSRGVPELLFVCVHNAGRSQMAAAIAEHLAPGRVHVRSAGSAPTGELNPQAIAVLAERGIDLSTAYPKPLTDTVLRAADVVVTMGCGDTCPVLPGKRYLDWDVADPDGATLDAVRDVRDDLQRRIIALLRDLDL